MNLPAGTRIGPYEVVSGLGAGGMGEVYRATDTILKRQVALKVIKAGIDTRQVIAPFEVERQALSLMDHPTARRRRNQHRSSAVRQEAMEFVVLNRDGYSNISGRTCPPNSMILSAGMFKRFAASRIASALGASYRQ